MQKYIIEYFLQHILPPIITGVVVWLFTEYRFKKKEERKEKNNKKKREDFINFLEKYKENLGREDSNEFDKYIKKLPFLKRRKYKKIFKEFKIDINLNKKNKKNNNEISTADYKTNMYIDNVGKGYYDEKL